MLAYSSPSPREILLPPTRHGARVYERPCCPALRLHSLGWSITGKKKPLSRLSLMSLSFSAHQINVLLSFANRSRGWEMAKSAPQNFRHQHLRCSGKDRGRVGVALWHFKSPGGNQQRGWGGAGPGGAEGAERGAACRHEPPRAFFTDGRLDSAILSRLLPRRAVYTLL